MEGKIYKICSENGDKIYIGSTIQKLSERMWGHKKDYKMWKVGNKGMVTSCVLFDEYGVDNCNIVLLEEFSCETKQQLHEREAYYIKTMSCVNKHIPLRTHKEYYQANKEKIRDYNKEYRQANQEQKKEWYQANKEKIKEQQKEYYQDNCEAIREKHIAYNQANKEKRAIQKKAYCQANKEKISIQKKEYYQANKEKIDIQRKARKAKVSSQPV